MTSNRQTTVLGVDVGGTFTDFFLLRDGSIETFKYPSSPNNPADSILKGIVTNGWRPKQVTHGTTVATNTVLERSGARVAFLTSKGFAGMLEIGRQSRPDVYDLEPRRPASLVPRELCFEADERLDFQGEVIQELRPEQMERVVAEVSEAAPDAAAVCLLFSFLNPEHERRLGDALRRAGLEVSLSSDVLPEPREYERAVTTILGAYVGPKMKTYLTDLDGLLREQGCDELSIIQSNGGKIASDIAAAGSAVTLLSGPAAGVAGAFAEAQQLGLDQIITLDMGGTSTDVCLCPGRIPYTNEWSLADLPVRLPAVDVHSVGTGGGSIAHLDEGGALRVGPQSAGAQPGPAAYGKGGPATTTDAQLVLGRLDEDSFLSGSFAASRRASEGVLGELGLGGPSAAAKGILTVANSVMSRALRVVSVERGFDPSDFTLTAFGGAGPLHACDLAEALRIRRILVPRYPGLMSAVGMVSSDAMRDYSAPLPAQTSLGSERQATNSLLATRLAELAARAQQDMGRDAILEPALDLRYAGQGFDLTIAFQNPDLSEIATAFHAQHEQRYGHADAERSLELNTVRLRARTPGQRLPDVSLSEAEKDATAALTGTRTVEFDEPFEAPVYDRELLLAGNAIEGPAIVSQFDSTTLVAPGWRAQVDRRANLILEKK